MEISEMEYMEMKSQIEQLKAKVDSIGGIKSIREAVEYTPHEFVRNIEDDVPVFVPVNLCGDAWNTFMKLAKLLHTQDYKFYMDFISWDRGKKYIRSTGHRVIPSKVSQLSSEEKALSIQMLNELIPIYNKYFQKAHESVLYRPDNCGDFQRVKVTYQEE